MLVGCLCDIIEEMLCMVMKYIYVDWHEAASEDEIDCVSTM